MQFNKSSLNKKMKTKNMTNLHSRKSISRSSLRRRFASHPARARLLFTTQPASRTRPTVTARSLTTAPPKPPVNRFIRAIFKFSAAIVFVFVSISAFADPPTGLLDDTHAAVRAVMAVQSEVTPDLLQQAEILGTAVGVAATGVPVLTVYVDRDAENAVEVIRNLPREFRGVGVHVELTDEIQAMANTAKQAPPIWLGTSGGWAYDLANGYCCSGTLGSLVWIGGYQYILSNNHVLEGDTVLGGNNRIPQTGDPVIQPGLIDLSCNRTLAQTVGTLVKRNSLPNSNVDCAIARVRSGMIRTDGAILQIGTISRYTSLAALNQHVKKSGRTTGLTRSWISGLNATIKLTYTKECHGATWYKTFTGQIVVYSPSSTFIKAGDSGSLLVQDVSTNPRAIGLLYGGNSNYAFANPISQVLTFLGASMVGK
jgi:hypothetical protein